MSAKELVNLQHVGITKDGRSILDHIDLSLASGEIVTLIGPNGAGKSTLVKLILGLEEPSRGVIQRTPGLRIGYMPQHIHIEQTMPLKVQRLLSIAGGRQSPDVGTVLAQVNATHLADKSVQSLSGGELQRILLARALLRNPQLLVLDEPVQGVDINGQAELYKLITRIRDERGCAVLMVSHDLHLVMATTDRVICMNHHICCSGLPEHVSNDPAYQELFGLQDTDGLALYAHHHDHSHDEEGNVLPPGDSEARHG